MNFTEKLNDKRSTDILKNIYKFVNIDFKLILPLPKIEISRRVQDFISTQVYNFSRIWKIDTIKDSDAYAQIIDGLEKNITINLYSKIFSNTHIEIEDDYKFELHVESLKFINLDHLEVSEQVFDEDYFKLAISTLQKINQYKCPKDKILMIINFCNVISTMISSSTKKVVGADEVFPLIVYAVLKGNIRKLKSNLSFIELFRHKTRLESEEEYYVTTLTSVVQFVENITSKAIRMDELNFNNLINKEKKRINIDKDKEISNIFLKKNNDENYLLYYLNNNKNEENSNYVELNSINSITESKIPKSISDSIISSDDINSILNIDLNNLYNEYFNEDVNKMTIFKMEKMFNDFKIILLLIENFKNNSNKKNENKTKNVVSNNIYNLSNNTSLRESLSSRFGFNFNFFNNIYNNSIATNSNIKNNNDANTNYNISNQIDSIKIASNDNGGN